MRKHFQWVVAGVACAVVVLLSAVPRLVDARYEKIKLEVLHRGRQGSYYCHSKESETVVVIETELNNAPTYMMYNSEPRQWCLQVNDGLDRYLIELPKVRRKLIIVGKAHIQSFDLSDAAYASVSPTSVERLMDFRYLQEHRVIDAIAALYEGPDAPRIAEIAATLPLRELTDADLEIMRGRIKAIGQRLQRE